MREGSPRVTVGVPVFNGEPFLSETLDSLLNQTFPDFEIVISDNSSTDRTEQICRDYAARDPRVRYHRESINRGATWNHNRVFELARGEFFKWNAADDLCAPEFLAQCVAALDGDASAIMVCSNVLVIDDYGDPVRTEITPIEVASKSALQRFRRISQSDHSCFHIYSLIRSDVLRRTNLLGYFNGSDRVLLSHLSLLGPSVLLPEPLLFNRDHPARFSRAFSWRSREGTVWFHPDAAKEKLLFPYWRIFGALCQAISRSPLRGKERLRCYETLLGWFRYHRTQMLDDLLYYPRMRWLALRDFVATRISNGSNLVRSLPHPSAHTEQQRQEDGSPASTPIAQTDAEGEGDRNPISVTVVVCTYNRCQELTRTLEGIAASRMPNALMWEVLVVDNNSTDQTREVVQDFCRRYPRRFRYLFEKRPGKAYALNSGIADTRGEVLAFVDDDVTVERRWLRNLTAGVLRGEWAGVVGRILPVRAFSPPPWLSREPCAGLICGNFDLGNHSAQLDFKHAPIGGNMAFHRAMFDRYGGFRPDLGPGPNCRPSGDTEFGRRLMRAGERLCYEPLAVVYHPVLPDRLTKEYFLSWWFDFGRASIRERGNRPDVCGIPWDCLSLARRIVAVSMMSLRGMVAVRAHKRFSSKCMVRKEMGMIVELYHRLIRHHVKLSEMPPQV